jgi:E3 ubiquitin-protein ligase SIAH1
VESEQQHDEDDDIGEEQSEGERVQQVVSDRSDGEDGVEDEQQADEEGEEAPAPRPHDVQGNVAAVEDSDDDRPISVVSRARTLVHGASTTSTAPAQAPPESPPAPPSFSDSSSVIRNVTVENSSAFDCSICYLPLKSPIFQVCMSTPTYQHVDEHELYIFHHINSSSGVDQDLYFYEGY